MGSAVWHSPNLFGLSAVKEGANQAGCGGQDQGKEAHRKPHDDGVENAGSDNAYCQKHKGEQNGTQDAHQEGIQRVALTLRILPAAATGSSYQEPYKVSHGNTENDP